MRLVAILSSLISPTSSPGITSFSGFRRRFLASGWSKMSPTMTSRRHWRPPKSSRSHWESRTGNDGTITRFGWKAQNKSLLIFAGEAYNVEQGVTNELFPNERETDPSCQYNDTPEDHTPMVSV